MALTFSDLVSEVKYRSINDQSGTEFDTTIKLTINNSLFRIARDANWTILRRIATFDTEQEYTTGTGAVTVTNGSKSVTITGATLITDNIQVGRRIELGGSSLRYNIVTITSETTLTVDINYDGTSSAAQTYKIFGREEYNLPAQVGKVAFLFHEYYGNPCVLNYNSSFNFLGWGTNLIVEGTPTEYFAWAEDMVLRQPNSAAVMRIASSSSADTSKDVTVYGTVSGYPDQETITTNASNGTTVVSGSKLFSKVERVVKDASTTGRITVDTNSAAVTIAVLPAGDGTAGITYKKVRVWPVPDNVFPMNVWYYKMPWRLVNDDDVHELGQDFDEAIILLSVAKIKYQNNQKEGDRFLGLYKDELTSLRKVNADKLDFLDELKTAEQSRKYNPRIANGLLDYRQLGGQYGVSSYR
jgi:hypothetical protein